jgi:hypothetical protein
MTILTEAGKDAVDGLSATVEGIEEEVRNRIEDAVHALDRWAPAIYDEIHGAEMDRDRAGDYLEREAVLAAVKRGAF